MPQVIKRGTKIRRGGRFPDPTLLISYRNDACAHEKTSGGGSTRGGPVLRYCTCICELAITRKTRVPTSRRYNACSDYQRRSTVGLWSRIRTVFGAKVNKALDRMEDPTETLGLFL